jgi:acetylornithine deacetylase/succinyl-diaminopimelate desuccinylase-like protein
MKKVFILALLTSLLTPSALGKTIEDEATSWLQAFVQVDTINPPGNESRAVEFYRRIFDAEGIVWQSAESAPGRGNIWARIEGGDKPPLVLLQHTDVVPADVRYWTTEPLSGEIRDGYLWGRGTQDMKATCISHLAAFIKLHRAGKKLNRDIVFVAAADEEAGGKYGVGWLIENHPQIFAGAGMLLNEGGGGLRTNGQTVFGVEVTQKVPVWLRLTAVDVPGHGSSPRVTSSVTRLVQALDALYENPFPPRVIPAVEGTFLSMAVDAPEPMASAFANITESIKNPEFVRNLHEKSPRLNSLLRDTCSVTRLEASNKINVIPPQAWAEVDCRILPDRPSAKFVEDFEAVISGTGVEVEVLMAFTPAVSSTENEMYRAIESFAAEEHPGSRVMPAVLTGFTDSHFTRDLGIPSYGFSPVVSEETDMQGIHGNDERIQVKAFERGVGDLITILRKVVYD